MKVVDINGRFLTQATTGVQRYATQLVQALDRQLTRDPALRGSYRLRLVVPTKPRHRTLALQHIPLVAVGHLTGHGWEQLELPVLARGRLLLNLCNTAPLVGRTLVTIHDASVFAVPEAYSPAFRTWYRTLLPMVGRRSERVITVSQFSRGELVRWAGIPPGKVEVSPPGAEHILGTPADMAVLSRLAVTSGRYILAVGSRSPHKNLESVTRAVAQLGSARLPLVVAGGANARVFAGSRTPDADRHDAGYVSDGELRALYEHAACFVYPSLYEGFGLPPLEAMACGCPVVVSNAASLPEVCGDAALYCNPQDPGDISSKIRMLIQDPDMRDELRRRGLAQAREFTWERASRELLDIIDRVQAA
jgi:glycosyltransferase involved in cell wall biosynthesis